MDGGGREVRGGGACCHGAATDAAGMEGMLAMRSSTGTLLMDYYQLPLCPDVRSLCVLPRGGTQVMLVYASGQCMEQRKVFTVVAFCAAWIGGEVL